MFAEAAEAIRTLQELEMQGHSNNGGLWLAYALAKSGRVTEARLGAESWLRSRSRKGPGHAALLLALGEKDRAIEALEQSAKQHMPSMVWVKSTPELAPLADDPRFVALLARMDLNRQ
jgi:hypothetical protein